MIASSAKRTFCCYLGLIFLCLTVSVSTVSGDEPELTKEGFLEFENLFQVEHRDSTFDEANKKNELRGHLKLRYGTDALHVFMAPDIYLSSSFFRDDKKIYPYSSDSNVSRNLKISGESAELSLNEFYVHYSTDRLRIRLGNQIYGWGTGDVFNPTSYFNPYDMRESFYKDDDEYKEGVFSLSGMLFMGSSNLELVMVPFHTPPNLAKNGSYWHVKIDNYPMPIILDDPQELDPELSNAAFGARLTSTILNTDLSVSVFHGPDTDLLYVPVRTLIQEGSPVSVEVEARSNTITYFGMDFSKAIDTFVIQGEAAFSPNKPTTVDQSGVADDDFVLPFEVDTAPYLSYTLGCNYFIPLYKLLEDHEGDTVLTLEWFQSFFLKDGYSPPMITDLFIMRLEDSYFDNHLSLSISGVYDTKQKGYTLWPKIGYDFLNGFSTNLSYIHIEGESDSRNNTASIFYYFRNNDSLIWKVRYAF
ncbi:MAG: hypothetical protein KKD44_02390 [Proteobacteria bacterium]|nr:hypothetical protein [Pseudomonadota bacterium]